MEQHIAGSKMKSGIMRITLQFKATSDRYQARHNHLKVAQYNSDARSDPWAIHVSGASLRSRNTRFRVFWALATVTISSVAVTFSPQAWRQTLPKHVYCVNSAEKADPESTRISGNREIVPACRSRMLLCAEEVVMSGFVQSRNVLFWRKGGGGR